LILVSSTCSLLTDIILQLAGEQFTEISNLLPVRRVKVNYVLIWNINTIDADAPAVSHFPGQSLGDFHGLNTPTAKGFLEKTFNVLFQTSFQS
jgi:hypothetical protein